LIRFHDDGRIDLDTNIVERSMRPQVMLESLCIPSSSVCKHWNRAVVSDATRATFSGHRRFDRLRRQVVGSNLVWRAGHHLHRGQHAGFDQAAYRVAMTHPCRKREPTVTIPGKQWRTRVSRL
jgi:transposase